MDWREVVAQALAEDIGPGDITTETTVPASLRACGVFLAKAAGVLSGLDVAAECFRQLDPACDFQARLAEGDEFAPGTTLAVVTGSARALLTAERTALNFLQRLCGTATLTRAYVDRVAGTKARIVDTRKTTPGLRRLQKTAVRAGGGHNHRFALYDGVLLKDNHLALAGGVAAAVAAARAGAPHTLRVEVEVTTLPQLQEAIAAGADVALLDNMDLATLRQAVQLAAGRILLEASGGVNLDTVSAIAATGVDLISVGALTHSAPAVDISLEIEPL
ncbi:MAG: carboxylating nicotinate-nucleotide diphosphorylase [Armatimonadetes bacterium]|nr:carboxylating nicotinate-nucleotide diphosphorylase [Armatimonadota bacterium]